MFDAILAFALFLNPVLGANGQLDRFTDTLLGFLPIALFIVVLYFFLRRQQKSSSGKLYRDEKERHIQHMQRMEELAERIAKALERGER